MRTESGLGWTPHPDDDGGRLGKEGRTLVFPTSFGIGRKLIYIDVRDVRRSTKLQSISMKARVF